MEIMSPERHKVSALLTPTQPSPRGTIIRHGEALAHSPILPFTYSPNHCILAAREQGRLTALISSPNPHWRQRDARSIAQRGPEDAGCSEFGDPIWGWNTN